MKATIRRAIGSTIGVAALLGSSLVLSSGPAQAAGGGCRPAKNRYFKVSACIGDDGVWAGSDAYIERFTGGSNCVIEISTLIRGRQGGATSIFPCRVGRIDPAQRIRMQRGLRYYTHVVITDGVRGHGLTVDSPDAYIP